MTEMKLLLKPDPFHVHKVGNPEPLYQDFMKPVSNFKEFLNATGGEGINTATHADCSSCKKEKATLRLVRGDKKSLFSHVGGVTDPKSFEVALTKVPDGIRQQNNQTTARFKLLQQIPQGRQCFAECYMKFKQSIVYGKDLIQRQHLRCDFIPNV